MKLPAMRTGWIAATLCLAAAAALPVDPPDLELNVISGLVDAVDATWSGSNYNVRFTEATSTGLQTSSILLTNNAANDMDPRIACAPNGDVLVVWWRDLTTDSILYRKRVQETQAWSEERSAGTASESRSHPRIIYAGNQVWVAYQIQNSKSRAVGAQIIDDDPEPIHATIGTTTYNGDLDVQLNFEQGHLWITWIDSTSRVGYSEYNHAIGLWSAEGLETYSSDSVAAARARIRTRILSR